MNKLLFAIIVCLTAGCISNKVYPPNFPPGIATMCQQQLDASKAAIERCGSPLTYNTTLTVTVKPGTKFIDGMWCYEWTPGNYIGGMTYYGRTVEVGGNPKNLNDVNPGVLFHEFGHFWLHTNYGIDYHDPKYDSAFHWSRLGMLNINSNSPVIYDTPANLKNENN
jgi:hypothetical protein